MLHLDSSIAIVWVAKTSGPASVERNLNGCFRISLYTFLRVAVALSTADIV